MASRYNTSPLQGQQQQQRYAPSNQFQEGHTFSTESSDWNAYSDQSMKPSTASVSSIQSWVSTDPSASNYANQYNNNSNNSQSQQQPAVANHYSPHQSYVPPPRGSSVTPSARNRSNSNNSTASGAGMGYGYGNGGGYTGSHLSHVSQMSNSSAYSQQQQQQQQQQQYQPQQSQQYQDLSTYHPSTSFNGAPNANGSARPDQQYSQQGYHSYDTQHANESNLSLGNSVNADNHTPNFQQPQPLYPHQHPQQHQRQHRSTPSDASHISVNRAFQQESLMAQSQSLMQSIDQVGPSQQSSPRMNHRSVPKRREQGQAAVNMTPDGDLPSLDQYEAMLQKMASPTLGPSSPREARSNLRRTEHDRENRAARQARKQQQQQQPPMSMDQMLGDLEPPPPAVMVVRDPSPGNQSSPRGNRLTVTSVEERKLRRRSSLPTSLANSPSQLMTNLRRRNSGHHSPMDSSAPSATLQVHPLDNPFGHRPLDMGTRQDLSATSQGYENSRRLLHVDEDDDNGSVISDDSERQRLDQQRRNKRDSPRLSQLVAKPPLTTKSQLRLSHTLSQTDVDEVNMLASPGAKDGDLEVASVAELAATATTATESQKMDEGDRQIEQFQWELSQLQQGVSPPRNLTSPKLSPATPSSSRSRATTPLGIVAEELLPVPTGPSRQQLLASLEDGGPKSGPNRTTSPVSMMKSRPTTPVSGIRPPPGPAPPMMSAPILGTGAYPSPPPSVNGGPRKGTRDPTRRAKPSPPVSSNIMPPTTPRPRTGSIAMMDGMLNQAPPTLPLPSLPPPPPPSAGPRSMTASSSSETATQRRRKPSGGRDLVQPSAQLLAEYTFGGQDSLPTPAPSLPMTPEIGSNGPSPSMLEKEKELVTAKDEIQRLQALLAEQDKGAAAALEARQELETKLEAMMTKKLQEEGDDIHRSHGSNNTVAEQEEQLKKMRQEQSVQQESNAALQQELEIFTERLQQEEAQYRTLQDTVQRLTLKISRLETQHASEVEQIQRDHEEFLEKVVQDHADKLTDLTEQSKADSEQLVLKFRQEQQEQQGHAITEKELVKEQATFRAREKVLVARLDEQINRNQQLEARIFDLEKKQGEHDFEMDTWIKTNKSLERQLAIEQLQQQESRYQIDKVEQENRRLRAILADLNLAALLGRAVDNGDDEDEDEEENRGEIKSAYERQREKWIKQTELLERKMAKAEEEATAIMEKNMELMVALEMAHSS
ncbi:hypothetical protein BG015_001161 [Linnemannia schmuckeri]|uniref:Uncharacterized protein n=1 Tax=Linnemannia schmuckeri TaxID=64567 RepID=A0A9P5RTK6_9FUNG|nr:hypothetical protein BG015_001161 [Linnemannia schmuckeri]